MHQRPRSHTINDSVRRTNFTLPPPRFVGDVLSAPAPSCLLYCSIGGAFTFLYNVAARPAAHPAGIPIRLWNHDGYLDDDGIGTHPNAPKMQNPLDAGCWNGQLHGAFDLQKNTIRGGGGEEGIRVLTREVNEVAHPVPAMCGPVALGGTNIHQEDGTKLHYYLLRLS